MYIRFAALLLTAVISFALGQYYQPKSQNNEFVRTFSFACGFGYGYDIDVRVICQDERTNAITHNFNPKALLEKQ